MLPNTHPLFHETGYRSYPEMPAAPPAYRLLRTILTKPTTTLGPLLEAQPPALFTPSFLPRFGTCLRHTLVNTGTSGSCTEMNAFPRGLVHLKARNLTEIQEILTKYNKWVTALEGDYHYSPADKPGTRVKYVDPTIGLPLSSVYREEDMPVITIIRVSTPDLADEALVIKFDLYDLPDYARRTVTDVATVTCDFQIDTHTFVRRQPTRYEKHKHLTELLLTMNDGTTQQGVVLVPEYANRLKNPYPLGA